MVGAAIALSMPVVEVITVASWAITEMPAPMPPQHITTNRTQPLRTTANLTTPRITANLTTPRITANPTQPQRITANHTTLLTPQQRMVAHLTVEAESLMVVAENTTSQ
jgi:hypothetical protein